MPKKLEPGFSYSFEGKIWKTLPDIQSQLLAVEIRDIESHRVHFSILDTKANKMMMNKISLQEPWWISLDAFQWPLLYIKIYPDEQNPADTHLIAYDLINNSSRWVVEHFEPVLRGPLDITGYSTLGENREVFSVNIETGVKTIKDGILEFPFSSAAGEAGDGLLFYPVQYLEGEENFQLVKGYLEQNDIHPGLAIDYIELDNRIIIGYYENLKGNLENILLILDLKGNILFKNRIGSNLAGIGVNTFFVMGSKLVYTTEKVTLVCMNIQ